MLFLKLKTFMASHFRCLFGYGCYTPWLFIPVFSSMRFAMPGCNAQVFSAFSVDFCLLCDIGCNFILVLWIPSFATAICWRDRPFPMAQSWQPCWRLVDRTWVGLFPTSLFSFTGWEVCFVPVPYCFDYCGFVIYFKTRKYNITIFILLSQMVLAPGSPLGVPNGFEEFLSISVKNAIGILRGIAWNV